MEDIIRTSGLSAGAVYGYFAGKDDLILAAVTTSLAGIASLIEPVTRQRPSPPPDKLLTDIATAIAEFTNRDGFDLKRIALLGWSEAQRNERLRETMRTFYLAFRSRLADAAEDWRRDGLIKPDADPAEAAKVLMSLILGFVVQSAIIGDVDPASIGEGLKDFSGFRN